MPSQAIKDLHRLGEYGLLLWQKTDDPITLSAAKILLRARTSKPTLPEIKAKALIEKQLEAYAVLYTRPLV